jgi:hypothetical protein
MSKDRRVCGALYADRAAEKIHATSPLVIRKFRGDEFSVERKLTLNNFVKNQ